MASQSSSQAKATICAERQRLGDAFLKAVHELMELQSLEIAEFTGGGDGLSRFDLAITAARRKKYAAKQAYVLHLQNHDC